MMKSTTYDVIIIGGGIVGLTLACALQDYPLRIAMIENNPPQLFVPQADYDIRVSAISRASQHIFSNLGIWPMIEAARVSPYREMHVWDSSSRGMIHFNCEDLAENNLGYIIENQVLQTALYQKLQEKNHLEFIIANPPQAIAISNDNLLNLHLKNGTQLRGKLLVGADGGQSWVRQAADIGVTSWEYGHTAIVGTVRTELSHQATAWQCFLPDGPLAFLPLGDENLCSIVWSAPPEQAIALLQKPLEEFNRLLAQAFEYRLGATQVVSQLISFPLQMRHAQHYTKDRIVLIGDAAHTLHPLAGQGVNLGLLDAACLAEIILGQWQKQRDIGLAANLRPYERWRKGHNLGAIAAMEGIKRLFMHQATSVRWLRHYGLGIANSVMPLKKFFMRQAMGLTGDLPKLAQQVINL